MKFEVFISILILFMCSVYLNGCDCQTALEGKWVGCDIRKPLVDWTLSIQGKNFVLMREDSNRWYEGQFKLNNNCVFKKIDFEINDTHTRALIGKILFGIYEINEYTLILVTSEPGKQARPLSFDDPTDAVVFDFVRS